MNIEEIAKHLIDIKARFDRVQAEYIHQRDSMHNALTNEPYGTYTWGGYKFTKIEATDVISVNKESVISALHSAGLQQDTINKILDAALIERERKQRGRR